MHISQLPFKKFNYGKNSQKPIEYTLPEDLFLEQWIIPKGTIIKLVTTLNFGWVITPDLGNPKRIFKY